MSNPEEDGGVGESTDSGGSLPVRVMVLGIQGETNEGLVRLLSAHGWQTIAVENLREAADLLSKSVPDVTIVDVDGATDELVTYIGDLRGDNGDLGIVVISSNDSADLVQRIVAVGADNVLIKPVQPWALDLALRKVCELRRVRQDVSVLQRELTRSVRDAAFPDIVTNCDSMKAVLALVEKVSPRDLSVLICGESGTGKELVARAIHQSSPRASGAFVELNCAALPPNLVESELFGHERGAFTGAIASRAGKIEQAHNGTLFLDEIGELPLEIQPKLLRALQERRITRIGGRQMIESDFRLVSATNRDLVEEMKAGRFREDLFYRVAVFPFKLPALRERIEDLELLLSHFLKLEGCSHFAITPGARELLAGYHWPGNVRELKNFAQAITLLSEDGLIDERAVQAYFGTRLRISADASSSKPSGFGPPAQTVPATREVRKLADVEREEILNAIQFFDGNVPEAARALGMGRATLYKYLNRAATQLE